MITLMVTLYWVLAIAIGVFLLFRYRSTGNKGLLVLVLGLSVWPLIESLFRGVSRSGVDRAMAGDEVSFPFSLITDGSWSAGSLAAVVSLTTSAIQLAIVLVGLVLTLRGRSEPIPPAGQQAGNGPLTQNP